MLNKLTLQFIILFNPLFKKFGVDTFQLNVILATKLKMDDRRPNVYSRMGNNQQKETKNSSWYAFIILAFTGLFLTFFLAVLKQPYLGHTVYFSAFMVMLAITLISDFTSVLIDVRDNYIILPRPVNDVTFTVSRILHIAVHTSKMALGLALSGLVYMFIWESPIAGIIFLVQIFIATILSIFLVNIVYLLVLKLTSPERFKDFISYFQIIFSVIIFAGYYTLPRLIDSSVLKSISITDMQLIWLLPPVWIAALHELLVNTNTTGTKTILLGLLAILSPVLSLYLVIKVLAPGFNKKLSSISGSGTDETAVQSQKTMPVESYMSKIAAFLAPHPVENAGFKITWLLSSRYRDFKVKVYPVFAYLPVYFVFFGFLSNNGSFNERWNSLREGSMYILLAYLTSVIILTVLQHVSQTEKHKASWIYFSTPHNQPGRILGGMFKAIIAKFYAPYFLLITILSIVIWGPQVINDFLLALAVSLIYGLLTALFLVKGFPFSQPVDINKAGKIFISLLLMIVPIAIGFFHYWAAKWETAIWAAALILLFIVWLMFNYYTKETWEKLEMAER